MKIDHYETHALMEITARPPLVFVEGEARGWGIKLATAIWISSRAGRSTASAIHRRPLPMRSPRRPNGC